MSKKNYFQNIDLIEILNIAQLPFSNQKAV